MQRTAVVIVLLLASCTDDPVVLTVDVVSDWIGGRDFIAVDTELSRLPFTDSAGGEVRQESYRVDGSERFLRGARVADLVEVGTGRRFVRVSLRSAAGTIVAQRVLDLSLAGSFAATVLLTRSCQAVVCPAPAGAAELSECQAGRCVDPRCLPSIDDPELCPPGCADDAACEAELGWCEGAAVCRSGGCLCDDEGIDVDPPTDAGTDTGGCLTTEGACADGLDEDCDGLTDCADPDCRGASCDDSFYCTTNDRCGGDGACSDTSPTCPSACNESSGSCDECAGDGDCGAATTGSWGGCGGFSSSCDTTGTQSRTVTTFACAAGSCASTPRGESRGCSRAVADGTACAGGYCCSSACVPRNSNAHCGVCNLNCSAQGQTCTNAISNNGTPHALAGAYVCTCPGLNTTCVAIGYGSAASCYQNRCQCQCATSPSTCGGQCATGICNEDVLESRSDNFCTY